MVNVYLKTEIKSFINLLGGEFTRQAEVTFLNNNERVTIKQKFSGIDEHGHLTISTELEGKVPEIPFGSSVHIEPYTELYHSSSSGELNSCETLLLPFHFNKLSKPVTRMSTARGIFCFVLHLSRSFSL